MSAPLAGKSAIITGAASGVGRAAAIEYAKQNIRVNAIAPGMINTGMTAGLDEATPEFAASLHPVGRLGEPQEPAAAALWLRSDAASFVTSSTLVLDGGYTAA